MKAYIILAAVAVALFLAVFGSTWKDGSQRKFGLGRWTFWFPHMSLRSLFSWRFWRLNAHHEVNGGRLRGSWGPVAFNVNAKDLE